MSDRIDLRTSEMKIDDCLQRIEALEQKPCMNITEIFTIEEVTEIKKIIEAINPKIPFNKNRFFGSNFLTDLKKEIAELKVGSVRQTEILKVITEGRILELDAYNRLESVLKKFMIMQEKMQNAMSPCSYDEEWYFHPLHKLIDELSGEKDPHEKAQKDLENEIAQWDEDSKPESEKRDFYEDWKNDVLLPQIKKSFPEHILISRELFNRFKAWCWEYDRALYEELKEVEKS